MSDWIRVSERLPDAGVGVLVTNGKVVTAAELDYIAGSPYYWDGHGFCGYDWNFDFDSNLKSGHVTHWMPLPRPPEA